MLVATELKSNTNAAVAFKNIKYRMWHPLESKRSGKRWHEGRELNFELNVLVPRVENWVERKRI